MSGPPKFSDSRLNVIESSTYSMNRRIMVASIIVLFLVTFFILVLHIYAKWFWRRSTALAARRSTSWRRRHRFDFSGDYTFGNTESVGLDKAVIDSLPTFTYEDPPSEEDVLECAVCLCEFLIHEKGRVLPKCHHCFHIECIDMWLHSHSTCPLCRTSAVNDSREFGQEHLQDTLPRNSPVISENLNLSEHVGVSQPNPDANTEAQGTACSSQSLENERRPISDRNPQNQVVQYPTNVLFWGDQMHVSSQVTRPQSEQVQLNESSLPHAVVEIGGTPTSFAASQLSSINLTTPPDTTHSIQYSSTEEQPYSPNMQAPKSPVTRLKNIKRLLSRERKVFPTYQTGFSAQMVGQSQAGEEDSLS
eukprot:c26346_g1_i4 orf=374-1459(-)